MWRGPHPILLWVYTIHEKTNSRGLFIHWNVSQENIVRQMEAVAKYTPNQYIQVGLMHRRRIMARKWSFERGMFFYLVEGSKKGQQWSMAEEDLEKRILSAEEEHA